MDKIAELVERGKVMIIQDLHSHTYYSDCGKDEPKNVVETALKGGIELLGITDHNYGIGKRKRQYYEEMSALKEKYAGKIKILCGIEIATVDNRFLTPDDDISYMDYCLVEHIDNPESRVGINIADFSKKWGIPTGIAHTDLFSMLASVGKAPEDYFKYLAENNIFWEMNVNYDSIHNYREHEYVRHFCEDEYQQNIVRSSGVRVSVGFDGHRADEYKPERVKSVCEFLDKAGIKTPFCD